MDIEDNVVYDVVGHGYYLEEGFAPTATNELRRNLAVNLHGCPNEADDGTNDDVPEEHDAQASGFFFTDPRNVLVNNAAAGAMAAGFWFDADNSKNGLNLCADATLDYTSGFPPLDTALFIYTAAYDATEYAAKGLTETCHGAFVGNAAHSSHDGLWAEEHKDQLVRILDFTAYKNNRRAINVKNHGVTEVVNLRTADNATAIWPASHAYHMGYTPRFLLVDSLLVGESANIGTPLPGDPRSYPRNDATAPIYGVEVYEGHLHVARTAFELFDKNSPAAGKRAAFGRHQSFPFYSNNPDNSVEAITIDRGSRPVWFDTPGPTASGEQMVMMRDLDGDITGDPGAWIVANDDFTIAGSAAIPGAGVTFQAGANAYKVSDADNSYGQLIVQWCARWLTRPSDHAGEPRCSTVGADGNGQPYTGWQLFAADQPYYDLVDKLVLTDEVECGGAGCPNVLEATHSPDGTHHRLGANILSGHRYYVDFEDSAGGALIGPGLADIEGIQVHYRYATAGDMTQVSVAVPSNPTCVAIYDGEVISDPHAYAAATQVNGAVTDPTEYMFANNRVILQLEYDGEEQSILMLFGPACP